MSAPPPKPPSPLDVARSLIGVAEIPGKNHHPAILRWLKAIAAWVSDDETPWCSAFANHCARAAGYETTGSLAARSWLKVGKQVALKDAKPGDVVIFWRGSPDGWQGHVAFLLESKDGFIRCLGGNQSDRVCVAVYPSSRLLGIRRLRLLSDLEGRSSRPA